MTAWNYILITPCFFLLVFIWYKEWRRPDRSRVLIRLVASLLAVTCFACLALPLTRKIQAAGKQGMQAILLTEGFDKDSVSSFIQHANGAVQVYVTDKSLMPHAAGYAAKYISPVDWRSIKQQVSAIHVFGYGFEKDELQALPGALLVFHTSKGVNGITAVYWPQKIKSGDRLLIQGTFSNPSPSAVKLILSGYGIDLDTAVIPAGSHTEFLLSDIPRQMGKAVYALRAVSGSDTLEKEPVPFEVTQPGRLKVLILSATPDFETKFLKLWLSQNGYALATRTTTSKNRHEKTFFNTPQVSFDKVSSSLLHDYDILIADQSELAAMSTGELAAIESQVAHNGMGLIVKADSSSARSTFYSRPFPVAQDPGSNRKAINVLIPVNNPSATALAAERTAFIRKRPGTQSLIEDKNSNIMVSSSMYGTGKLLYTTLNNTFTWELSGDHKSYQAFWSYLLEKAAAKAGADRSWSISTLIPCVNKAVEISYAGNGTEIPRVQVGGNFVHLSQDPDLPFQWSGVYWPEQPGWQPLMQENQNTYWWYAYSEHDWKGIAAAQKIALTRKYMAARIEEARNGGQQTATTVPVGKKYFLIGFLLCAGFLWFEKKL